MIEAHQLTRRGRPGRGSTSPPSRTSRPRASSTRRPASTRRARPSGWRRTCAAKSAPTSSRASARWPRSAAGTASRPSAPCACSACSAGASRACTAMREVRASPPAVRRRPRRTSAGRPAARDRRTYRSCTSAHSQYRSRRCCTPSGAARAYCVAPMTAYQRSGKWWGEVRESGHSPSLSQNEDALAPRCPRAPCGNHRLRPRSVLDRTRRTSTSAMRSSERSAK
jgi:hypothetical protein